MNENNTNRCQELVTANHPYYGDVIKIERGCSFKATHFVEFASSGCPARMCGRHIKRLQQPMFKSQVTIRKLTDEEKVKGWYDNYS